MEIEIDGENTVLGALVDSVEEVMDIDPDHIEEPPRIGTRLISDFMKGMGKRDNTFIIILNMDRLFAFDELALTRDMFVESAA
jgi:purine-binding chemotaxis protein CheW